jgi:hypothetical protein
VFRLKTNGQGGIEQEIKATDEQGRSFASAILSYFRMVQSADQYELTDQPGRLRLK